MQRRMNANRICAQFYRLVLPSILVVVFDEVVTAICNSKDRHCHGHSAVGCIQVCIFFCYLRPVVMISAWLWRSRKMFHVCVHATNAYRCGIWRDNDPMGWI